MSHPQDPGHSACIAPEFEGADLGDRRRNLRLRRIAELCAASPSKTLPDIAPTTPDLTAIYRFLRSDAVSLPAILKPHIRQTAIRCAEARRVLVLHDTTECEFSGETRDLGTLRGNDQGFLLHPSLAIAGDGTRRPLGLLAVHTWQRSELGRGHRADGKRKSGGDYHAETDKESARWWKGIDEAEEHLGGVEAIHVMDREGDAYHVLRDALEHDARFVIRMARDRLLLDDDDDGRLGKTSEVLACCKTVYTVEVSLSRRPPNSAPRSEPARDARNAKLAVTATKARIARPNYDRESPESLEVNLVCVREVDAPEGLEPVAWVLITTEPIDTEGDLRAIVDIYRTRWMIEEFFKALKTGCAFEKRQLESYETLTIALGVFLPIAWLLLLLRHQARTASDEPAERVLSPVQLQVLRARLPKLLPRAPTAADALRAVAYLGGHFIKRAPGWLVLGRGLQTLLELEVGWRLARGMELEL